MTKSRIKRKETHKSKGPLHLKGELDITRSGMGYIIVENQENDVMVRPNDFNSALHGDTVRVRITSDTHKAGRWSGVITEVLERKQEEFMGHIEMGKQVAFFRADTDKPMPDVFIPSDKLNGAKNNDTVIVRITQWLKNKKPEGEVIRIMDFRDEGDKATEFDRANQGYDSQAAHLNEDYNYGMSSSNLSMQQQQAAFARAQASAALQQQQALSGNALQGTQAGNTYKTAMGSVDAIEAARRQELATAIKAF